MAGLIKGVMRRVKNLDQRFGSNPEYVAVKVPQDPSTHPGLSPQDSMWGETS